MPFVHLHVHTQYSVLDGAAQIKDLFKKAKEDNQRALAITDHGNMFGVKEFLEVASKFPDIKPIVGCEFYVSKDGRFLKRGREDQSSYHLILLAKNYNGYKNLIKLSSDAYIEGFHYKPRIDRELIKQYSADLICSSACLAGEVSRAILAGDISTAEETAMWYKEVFGADYYLELQRHKTKVPDLDDEVFRFQEKVNKELLEIAKKHDIKCIATNDVHFVSAEDGSAHDRLICLTTNADYNDKNRLRYTQEEYLKDQSEMEEIFSDIPEALINTIEIADKIERYTIESSPIMPNFEIPTNFKDADEYLRELTYNGAQARYNEITEKHTERIDFELSVIKKMGFPDYFLIVQDFIAAARGMGVIVGPGRGSAAGSVVAYCLRITDIDPLRYDLLFERFLNPDRISMPDIDVDFDDDGRSSVLKYVEDKYGKDRVSHVITFGTMGARSSIRDMARIQGVPLMDADVLSKLIPGKFPEEKNEKGEEVSIPVTIDNCIDRIPEFKKALDSENKKLSDTIKFAKKLEGTVRNVGVHACAIIIGRDDLRKYIPISTTRDKETGEDMWVSQYDGSQIEKVGMLKMDFLGLKTLSIIRDTIANIKQSSGIELDISSISMEDQRTYDLFSRGDTVATFQFASEGMRKSLRDLKPNRFEDLIAMNALYRPGPMEYIPDFIERKHGLRQIEYDLPEMQEILQDTYGITVYQEQVMLLSQKLAGFTKGDADKLRKAMGKKIKDMMDELKTKFLQGGEDKGYSKVILEKIWKDWEAFAQYAFNKSHSTCYAWIGYQTAYLKANHPAEFMAANLSRNLHDIDEIGKLMDECKRMGIEVLGPDVNESSFTFSVNKEGNIRFGLAGIKGVGGAAVEAIITARKSTPFVTIFDFIESVKVSVVNKRAMEALAYSGAFDGLKGIERHQFFLPNSKGDMFLETLLQYGNRYHLDRQMISSSLFGEALDVHLERPEIPSPIEYNKAEFLKKEKELVGMYFSAHPMDRFRFEYEHFTTHSLSQLTDTLPLASQDPQYRDKDMIIAGIITEAKHLYSKSGRPYANFTLEDYAGIITFSLFGKDFERFMQYIQPDTPVLLKCQITERYPKNRSSQDSTTQDRSSADCTIKILNIRLLSNTNEDFIHEIKISLPVNNMGAVIQKGLLDTLKEHKGKSALIIHVTDPESRLSVEFISTKYGVSVSQALLESLDNLAIPHSFVPSLSF